MIPTAEQIAERGYEANEAIYYFGLPSPIAEVIEKDIKRTIIDVVE